MFDMTLVFVILFSATIGSFLTMLVTRLPKMEQQSLNFFQKIHYLSLPKSHCDICQKPLTPIMLIPVVSFILQKFRCKFCGARLSIDILIIELTTISLAIFLIFTEPNFEKSSWLFIFFATGLVLSMIDFKHHLLLDSLTLPLLWLGLLVNLFAEFTSLQSAVLGGIIGYLILWLVYQIFWLISKKEGLGYGDFKLFAAIGTWFGWQILPLVLLLASVLAILYFFVKKLPKNQEIPFGPFLIMATFLLTSTTLKSLFL